MSALVLLAALVCSGPITVSAEFPERVDSRAVGDVEGDLEKIGAEPSVYRLKLLNRNPWAVRIDYRIEIKPEEYTPVASVILRSRGGSELRNQKDWDRTEIRLPAGTDYKTLSFVAVVRGTVKERFGTRVSSNGTSEQYTELEFVEGVPADQDRSKKASAPSR